MQTIVEILVHIDKRPLVTVHGIKHSRQRVLEICGLHFVRRHWFLPHRAIILEICGNSR